jgi:hypothetical protein
MHQQLWGYKVEWKSVSRGMGGKKVEYHCFRGPLHPADGGIMAHNQKVSFLSIFLQFPEHVPNLLSEHDLHFQASQ